MSNSHDVIHRNVGESFTITISKRRSTTFYKWTSKLRLRRLLNSKLKIKFFSVLILAICFLLVYLIYHKIYMGNSSNSYSLHKAVFGSANPKNVLNDVDKIYSKPARKKKRYPRYQNIKLSTHNKHEF